MHKYINLKLEKMIYARFSYDLAPLHLQSLGRYGTDLKARTLHGFITTSSVLRPIYRHIDNLRALVTIHSGLARVRNVICATVGQWVGGGLKHGGFVQVQVCKIRPVQDCDLNAHFNHLANYQAKCPSC